MVNAYIAWQIGGTHMDSIQLLQEAAYISYG